MKNLVLTLVLLVSGICFSQENPAKMIDSNPSVYKMSDDDWDNLNSFYERELNGDSISQEVFKIFNDYRRYVGLHELSFDTTLQKTADIQAKYCSSIGKSTHIQNNNSTLKTPPLRLKKVDPSGKIKFKGEISSRNDYMSTITRKRTLSQSILDLFYYSKSHIKIIESVESTKIGVSIHKNEYGDLFVVAVFGS
jgi:uncharacterized protein YkwD